MIALCLLLTLTAPHDQDSKAAARAALDRLGKKHAELDRLAADFVQERTTPLMKRPLRSEGRLLYRRSPACVVLRTVKPDATVIRLDEKTYQVHRPRLRQLERFAVKDREWARFVFGALSHRIDVLKKSFDVVDSRTVKDKGGAETMTIRLAPRTKAARARMRELRLTLDPKRLVITGVAYDDRNGDAVRFTLTNVRPGAALADSDLRLDVPAGTRIIDHRTQTPPARRE